MYLVADSGSTKTDWIFLDKSGVKSRVKTKGINPFFRTTDDIAEELAVALLPVCAQVDHIFFHGAGIVNEEKGRVVQDALVKLYGAIPVETYSDVIGAARATCGDDPGIVCILGTGSNTCLYDGKNVVDNIPPMGYILGDEGSGTALGKRLLGDYFKRVMPEDLRVRFKQHFSIEKDDVLNRVYRQPEANKYLAGFSEFLSDEIHHDYCRDVLYISFKSFVSRNVLQLTNAKSYPISFVGSIAYHFQPILMDILVAENIQLGKVIREPIGALSDYYLRMIFK